MFGPPPAALSASSMPPIPVNISPNPGPTASVPGQPTDTSSPSASPTSATAASPSAASYAARKLSNPPVPSFPSDTTSSPRKGSIANFFSNLNASGAGGGGFGGGVVPSTGGGLASSQLASPRASISVGAGSAGFPHTHSGGGFGGVTGATGGMASSPNVPRPGTSIDPTTGKPYMAGLTRAELDAMRTKGAGLLDPTPAHVAARRGSSAVEGGRRPSEIGGREQAAAQLLGTGSGAGLGGTGSALGSAPNSPIMQKRGSIVDDLEKNVRQFQHRASSLVPVEVKNLFAEPKGKEPEGAPMKARRGSAAALFENVKNTATKLASDVSASVKEVIADPPVAEQTGAGRRSSILEETQHQAVHGRTESALKPTTGRVPGTAGADQSLLEQVQEGISGLAKTAATAGAGLAGAAQGLINQTARPGEVSVLPTSSATAVAPASLPSEEKTGSKPGDFSTGVGALPGKLGEAGVAVPPDVREKEGSAGGLATFSTGPATSTTTTGGSGISPVTGGLAGGGLGALAATLLPQAGTTLATSGASPAIAADSTPANASAPTTSSGEAASAPVESGLKNPDNAKSVSDIFDGDSAGADAKPSTIGGLPDLHQSTAASNSTSNLAAALPSTTLGDGAAKGATDVESTGVTAPGSTTGSSIATPASGLGVAALRSPNERATSLTSVTAVRHGQAGDLHEDAPSKETLSTIDSAGAGAAEDKALPSVPATESKNDLKAADLDSSTGQKSTTPGTGHGHTTSLTPGNESEGVGHPATRGLEGTSRTPGNYPTADHGSTAAATSTATAGEKSTPAPSSTAAPSTPAASSTPDVSKVNNGVTGGNGNNSRNSIDGSSAHHRRTSSSASGEGKKVGFMKKLKGEMKVIGGKITRDDEKVELGEKIKAGEA